MTPLSITSAAAGGMTATLHEFRNAVLFSDGKLGAVTSVGISLAAFCACISMIGITREYITKAEFDWWKFIRPILIFLLVCNFGRLVVTPLDAVCGVYNGRLSKAVGGSMAQFEQTFREVTEAVAKETEDILGQEAEELASSDLPWIRKKARGAALSVRKWVSRQTGAVSTTLSSVILGLVFIIFKIMCSVMVVMSTLYLVVMALIGPFTFALSILPGYSGGIKLWVERYIQYSLWIPLTHICCYLCTSLTRIDLSLALSTSRLNGVNSIGYCFTAVLLLVLSFRMIRQIPGVASYIIESGSHETLSRDMVQGLGSGLSHAARLLFK